MNAVVLIMMTILLTAGRPDAIYGAEPPRSDAVCVRNFFPEGADINPCESGSKFFRLALALADKSRYVCTKVYEDRFCAQSPKEYRLVRAADGRAFCTVNFHQEGIAEYCYSSPRIFSWVAGFVDVTLIERDRQ